MIALQSVLGRAARGQAVVEYRQSPPQLGAKPRAFDLALGGAIGSGASRGQRHWRVRLDGDQRGIGHEGSSS